MASVLPEYVRTVIVHQDHKIGLPIPTPGGCWMQGVKRLAGGSEYEVPSGEYAPDRAITYFGSNVLSG